LTSSSQPDYSSAIKVLTVPLEIASEETTELKYTLLALLLFEILYLNKKVWGEFQYYPPYLSLLYLEIHSNLNRSV